MSPDFPTVDDDSECKMDEDSKRKYDALKSLNDQYWAEFQEKTRLEWRLSFGLWTSMVMAIGSIFAGKAAEVDIARLKWPAVFFCLVPIGLHFWFLWWIQRKLQAIRGYIATLRNEMWAQLHLDKQEHANRNRFRQPSFYVQLGITCLLAAILLASIFYSIPRNVQP